MIIEKLLILTIQVQLYGQDLLNIISFSQTNPPTRYVMHQPKGHILEKLKFKMKLKDKIL